MHSLGINGLGVIYNVKSVFCYYLRTACYAYSVSAKFTPLHTHMHIYIPTHLHRYILAPRSAHCYHAHRAMLVKGPKQHPNKQHLLIQGNRALHSPAISKQARAHSRKLWPWTHQLISYNDAETQQMRSFTYFLWWFSYYYYF